ncbi:hypothetical protein BG003_008012 [Podila horticola]|nr:hypothetical protein BG003_008012 [Podila horticola]
MFDQAWSMLRPSKSRSVMYYPGKAFSYTPGFINHILDQVDIQAHNIEMKKTSGGKGHEHWAVDFELMALKNARSTSRFTPRERKFVGEQVPPQLVAAKQMCIQDFMLRANEHVYVRSDAESSMNLESFLRRNSAELERIKKRVRLLIAKLDEENNRVVALDPIVMIKI